VGSAAPEFTLTSTAGETVSLSDFADQVVLLNFWSSG
jgi:peroxiredoxin